MQQYQGTRNHSLLVIHLLMVVNSLLVSTSFTVGAAIAATLDPAVLTLLRFMLAVLILCPYVYWRHGLKVPLSQLFRCSIISCCLVVFFWSMFLALRYTTALNTSIIFTLVPSFSGIYAWILVRERLGWPQHVALLCGIVGALWVIFRGDLSLLLGMQWNRGDLIFLGGCMVMGLYTPLVKLLYRGESMLVMTFWVLVTGSLWLLLFAGNRLIHLDFSQVPAAAWAGIGYLALFTTVTTFFLSQYCVPHIGPTRVVAYSYLYPGLVLLLDLALGRGLPSGSVLPGVFIVLAAMAVLQYSARRQDGKI